MPFWDERLETRILLGRVFLHLCFIIRVCHHSQVQTVFSYSFNLVVTGLYIMQHRLSHTMLLPEYSVSITVYLLLIFLLSLYNYVCYIYTNEMNPTHRCCCISLRCACLHVVVSLKFSVPFTVYIFYLLLFLLF